MMFDIVNTLVKKWYLRKTNIRTLKIASRINVPANIAHKTIADGHTPFMQRGVYTGTLEAELGKSKFQLWKTYFGDNESAFILYALLGSPDWFVDIDPDYLRKGEGLFVGDILKAGIPPRRLFPQLTKKEATLVAAGMVSENIPAITNHQAIAKHLFPNAYQQHFEYCDSLNVIRWAVKNEEKLLGQVNVFNGENTVHIEGVTLLRQVRDEHLPRGESTGLNYVKDALVEHATNRSGDIRYVDNGIQLFTDGRWESVGGLVRGDNSAYEPATGLGFEGNEVEWLESLLGPQGATGDSSLGDFDIDLPEFPHSIKDSRIRQLLTRSDLRKEGQVMSHCVGSYTTQCRNGSYIFNVDDGSELGATVEVKLEGTNQFYIKQAEGYKRRAAHEARNILVSAFIENGLQEIKIMANPHRIIREHLMCDIERGFPSIPGGPH